MLAAFHCHSLGLERDFDLQFNLRNGAKWRTPTQVRCVLLQTAGETQRSEHLLPSDAATQVPAGSAPAHCGSERPQALRLCSGSVHALRHGQLESTGEGAWEANPPGGFSGRDTSDFIQDLFSVSPFSPSPTPPAPSPLFPLSSGYFEFPSQLSPEPPRKDAAIRPSTRFNLSARSEPSSVWPSQVLGPCTCVF